MEGIVDLQAFYQGTSFDAHGMLGAHLLPGGGVAFRVFAPGAHGVEILLSHEGGPAGQAAAIPCARAYDGNFFEAAVAEARAGDRYELRIHHSPDASGATFTDHCDPFGFAMELRPAHRSIVCDLESIAARRDDGGWASRRREALRHDRPLNIYELHLASWRRSETDPERFPTYREIAEPLAAYLTQAGMNAVEFMPILEHPADESWGYQDTGFFSATSRYGSPADLMELIDTLHRAGIAVVLDFVPVHFACDAYGLARFTGEALFEYPHEAVGVSEWGSMNFMHSRGEVRSFLQSSAAFWMETYGFDGLRMDAVSRLIYWQGDERRGVNGNTVGFLKTMNAGLKARFPERLLLAEDSTTYPGVTAAVDAGGLGFDYKWDLGWMHDTLSFFQMPASERRANYHKLTFSMMYYYNERHLLALSHDENVHGKATIAQKMHGGYEGKFPQARCLYLYMAAHPGKKLLFMGSEFAQLREWDESREQDWCLLDFPVHDAFRRYMAELSHVYLEHPALWQRDFERDGFEWLDCHEEERLLYAFVRRGSLAGGSVERVACLINADEREHAGWRVSLGADAAETMSRAVPSDDAKGVDEASCRVLIDSDWQRFGGATPDGTSRCSLEAGPEGASLVCTLAPHSGMLVLLE